MSSDEDSEYDWGAFVVVRSDVNDKEGYDCIPSTWLVFDEESGRGYQTTVTFQFPSTSQLGKGIKFKKNQRPNKNWPDYIGKMLLDTDSQAEAIRFINKEKERVKKLRLEMGDSSSSSTDISESESEEEHPPPQSGTKRKKSEQNNRNMQAKSKKLATDAEDKIKVLTRKNLPHKGSLFSLQ